MQGKGDESSERREADSASGAGGASPFRQRRSAPRVREQTGVAGGRRSDPVSLDQSSSS